MSYTSPDRHYHTDFEDEIVPSQAFWRRWIQYEFGDQSHDVLSEGKWLVYVPSIERVDQLWPRFKSELRDGHLGPSVKARTIAEGDSVLVSVKTKDWLDIEDIRRVLVSLRQFAIPDIWRIFYKTDEMTLRNIKSSMYVSPYDDKIALTKAGYAIYVSHGLPLPELSPFDPLEDQRSE
jgi:Domain of unknown function (DUF1917)